MDLIIAALALAVAAAVGIRSTRQLARLEGRVAALTRGADGQSLEAVIGAHLETVDAVARELDSVAARTALVEASGRRAFQRLGLVRYNPFEETGGNQSFVLALLDANDDGFILTSLHTRSGTRVYARALSAGRSESALSGEETEALELARTTTKAGLAIADHPAGSARIE